MPIFVLLPILSICEKPDYGQKVEQPDAIYIYELILPIILIGDGTAGVISAFSKVLV